VTRLAREHGIVTPYTSYLIIEDERSRRVPVAMQTQKELSADAIAAPAAAAKASSIRAEAAQPEQRAGAAAVDNAKDLNDLKSVENVSQQRAQGSRLPKSPTNGPRGGEGGYKVAQNYGQQARVVNGRAFYQNGNTWTDATAQSRKDLKQKQVAFNSTEYFSLLSTNPDAAQWLALGNEVDVVLGDTLYQIR
jgi:Ca-activated chloride channel family protein